MHYILGLLAVFVASLAQAQSPIPLHSVVALEGGAGVVVAPGLVLTANHVVKDQEVLKRDEPNDLALIKGEGKPITLSVEQPSVGSEVVIVGCPLNQCLTITRGYITKLDDGEHMVVSAAAWPGNSGGPCLWYSTLRREWVLVGIVQSVAFTGNMFQRSIVPSVTFVKSKMDILEGIVKRKRLNEETR